jgi:hypothetical protein
MNVVREWRNIKMLKRGGKGYDSGGIDGTAPGELLVKCRCCPHPEYNLPANWRDADPSTA